MDAPSSRMAPESRWPAPPPMDLPKVTMSGCRSQHSERKQPVPPLAGSTPCLPRPHMISSAMTAMPRALVEVRVRVGVRARVRARVGASGQGWGWGWGWGWG